MKLQSRCWLGLPASEALTGAGGSTSKGVRSRGWHMNAGCLQEVSVPPYPSLFLGLHECSSST